MKRTVFCALVAVACVFKIGVPLLVVKAQIANTRGQNVVPVYEGWRTNPDGTKTMFFGYFSRNNEERMNIALGESNSFEPGPPDRGQPTHFYPRRQQFVFGVVIPADFGQKDLVWTLTSQGKTEKAYGSLREIYEIDNELIAKNMGAGSFGLMLAHEDKPPTVTVEPTQASLASVSDVLSLSATVNDDGVPPPVPASTAGTRGRGGDTGVFINVPVKAEPRRPRGLSIEWLQLRGPGMVTFGATGYTSVTNGGSASTTARFSVPGTYVLRAVGSDSLLFGVKDITVNVAGR